MGWTCRQEGNIEMHTIFLLENQRGKDHLKDLGVDGRIILECGLGK
jgi:hypothetical protein